eukprot:RCo003303
MSVYTPTPTAPSPGKSAERRQQLCEKMVVKIVQEHNRTHPERPADPKAINVIRHQLNEMLMEGPVHERDMKLLAKMLSKSVTPKPHDDAGHRSAAKGSVASMRRSTKSAPGSTTGNPTQDLSAGSPGFAAASGTGPRDPTGILTLPPVVPNDPSTLHDLAQQVRSLPPIQQKKLMLGLTDTKWSSQIQKDLEADAKRKEEEKRRMQQLRSEQRHYLDQQVRQLNSAKEKEKEESMKFAVEEAEQRMAWKESQEMSAKHHREQIVALKRNLMEQRQLALQRKAEEAKAHRAEEAAKVEAMHEELQKEELERRLKKEKVRQEISTYIEFNEKMKAEKEKEKKLLAEQDVQALKEYEAKLERQEEERKRALSRLYERQTRQFQLAEAQHVTLQAMAEADETKARREREEKEQKQAREEEERRQKHREDTLKMKTIVENQIREKEDRKRRQQEESQRLKDEMTRNAQLAEQKEMERRRQAKEFALQGMKDLDKQLVEMHQKRFEPPYLKVGERLRK